MKAEKILNRIALFLCLVLIASWFIPFISITGNPREALLNDSKFAKYADASLYDYCCLTYEDEIGVKMAKNNTEKIVFLAIFSFALWVGLFMAIAIAKRWYKTAMLWPILGTFAYYIIRQYMLDNGVVGKESSKAVFAFAYYSIIPTLGILFVLMIALAIIKRINKKKNLQDAKNIEATN